MFDCRWFHAQPVDYNHRHLGLMKLFNLFGASIAQNYLKQLEFFFPNYPIWTDDLKLP